MEPSSSSHAPSQAVPNPSEVPPTAVGGQADGNVISDVVSPEPREGNGAKRPQDDHATMEYDGAEVETKTQRISSIYLSTGRDDVTGEINAEDYDAELRKMEAKYEEVLEAKQCFVHIRAKRSSNKDLRMLSRMMEGAELKRVSIQSPFIDSVVTNSAYVAELLGRARCETKEGVEEPLEEHIKGGQWDHEVKGFEQHMLEENEVRVNWQAGKFEESELVCSNCGDRNAWDCVHVCCQDECKRHINALQSFPLAAWDDISAAPLNP